MTIRRSRWNWRLILIKRRRMTLISTTRGSVTGEMFSRTMKEVWTRRHCYMLSSIEQNLKGRGDKIVVGTAVKAKIGEL